MSPTCGFQFEAVHSYRKKLTESQVKILHTATEKIYRVNFTLPMRADRHWCNLFILTPKIQFSIILFLGASSIWMASAGVDEWSAGKIRQFSLCASQWCALRFKMKSCLNSPPAAFSCLRTRLLLVQLSPLRTRFCLCVYKFWRVLTCYFLIYIFFAPWTGLFSLLRTSKFVASNFQVFALFIFLSACTFELLALVC